MKKMCECGKPVFCKGSCKTCYHRNYYAKVRRPRVLATVGECCAVCGTTEDLEFDHIDPTLKESDIRDNLKVSNAELAKCQLLCEPCHRVKSARENTGFRHGTMYSWMKKKCMCPECYTAKRAWHDARNARRRKSYAG